MRLFRQSRRGDWRDVFDAMALEVAALAARRAAPRLISTPCALGELIDKITILQDQGRADPRGRETGQYPPRTGAARTPRARGRSRGTVDRSAHRSPGRRQRPPVEHRGRHSGVRARGRLRAALRRARAIGLLRERCPRRAEARDQHPRQLGSGRGEELRLSGLSRGQRSSAARARTGPWA